MPTICRSDRALVCLLCLVALACRPAEAPDDAIAPPAAAAPSEPAPGVLDLRARADEARERGDLPAAVAALRTAHEISPQSLITTRGLAGLLVATGETEEALGMLETLGPTGASFDLTAFDDLTPVAGDPRFDAVLAAMERNLEPIATAEVRCELDAPDLMPEGIDLDPQSGEVVLGSFSRGQLGVADLASCTFHALTPPGTLGTVAGIRVDAERRLVWATSNASGPDDSAAPAIVAVGLDDGAILARLELPTESNGPVLLNDLALTADGTVFVTESLSHAVYRGCLECGGLEMVIASPAMPYANGIAAAPDGTLYVAHASGISRVDPASSAERRLPVPPGVISSGADGLYFHDGALIAVQNQPYHDRIALLRLDSTGDEIVAAEVLNARFPGEMFHSTGFVLDGRFYFNGVAGDLPPPEGSAPVRPVILSLPLPEGR